MASHQVGDEFAHLMELESPMVLHTVVLEKDGFTLELLAYDSPDTLGPADRRPMNQLGFTHLSLRVEDVAAVGEKVCEFGGQIFKDTSYSNPEADNFLYCTDPDGTRIELMRLNG